MRIDHLISELRDALTAAQAAKEKIANEGDELFYGAEDYTEGYADGVEYALHLLRFTTDLGTLDGIPI